jgi:hypothetical protein
MSNDDKDPKAELKKFKPKKKKLAVPEEFLDNAKSYDDKLILVKTLTEMEKGRVLLIMKSLLKEAVDKKKKV